VDRLSLSDSIAPHRHVKIRISKENRLRYTPPRGINVMWYGPNKTDTQIDNEKECFATFYTPIINPDEEYQKYIDNIDEELAKLKVLKDHITPEDEPNLVDPHIEVHVLLSKVQDNQRYQKYLTDLDAKKKRMAKLTATNVEDITAVRL
jgi:hypothetical protein